ncbi:MAG: hypothetical protein PVG39_07330 [Desulfobacteraceae bacterium]|jgi:virulence-associated protein VagC
MKKARENAANIQTGQNQIAQILREFEMGCDEAIIRREGKRLILEPKKRLSSFSKKLDTLEVCSPGVDIALLGTW